METPEKKVVMSSFTIYDHPTDFPHDYVVRRFDIIAGNPDPTDDPKIIETWM